MTYKFECTAATEERVHELMRAALTQYEPKTRPLGKQFWVGLVLGAVLIASMDYGDVHFCVGQCAGIGVMP